MQTRAHKLPSISKSVFFIPSFNLKHQNDKPRKVRDQDLKKLSDGRSRTEVQKQNPSFFKNQELKNMFRVGLRLDSLPFDFDFHP